MKAPVRGRSAEAIKRVEVAGRWPSPAGRAHVIAGAVLLVLVLAVAGAWVVVGDGFFVATAASVVVLGGSLFVAVLAPLLQGVRGRVRVQRRARALSFPGTSAERPVYAVAAVVAVLLPLALRWDAARTDTDVSAQFLVWSWVAVPFGLYGLVWVARRYVRPRVELSASGVRLVATGQDSEVSWDDLPSLEGLSRSRLVPAMRELGIPPHAATLVLSDPEVLARLVELYRTRKGLRGELASGAAIERLRRGDLAPEATHLD